MAHTYSPAVAPTSLEKSEAASTLGPKQASSEAINNKNSQFSTATLSQAGHRAALPGDWDTQTSNTNADLRCHTLPATKTRVESCQG